MRRFELAPTLFLLLLISGVCVAQSTGAIVGTVKDSSGGVVVGARVTVTNMSTAEHRSVVTDSSGNYTLTTLPIGTYEIAVEKSGYKKSSRSPITLNVDQTARVDSMLSAGDVNETVTVTGATPLIDTERADVGQVIDNQTITELPLDGRNFIQLGTLVPGATEGAPGNTTIVQRQEGQALSVNGMRAEDNNYMLDGLDNNDLNLGLAVLIPSVDAIQEFKVQTANYSAEFGRASGAVVQVATKSGSNQSHGTVYEFLRNQIFDAAAPFSTGVNPLKRNQFGFSLGGPVTIPKLYSGKDRTFFFYGAEWLRLRQGQTNLYTIPTLAQRSGQFASAIYDPFNVVGGQRQQFAGNRIPASRQNPIAVNILNNYFPKPTNDTSTSNYIVTQVSPTNSDKQTLRIDQSISDRDKLFLRLSYNNSVAYSPALPYNGNSLINHPRGIVLGYTRIFSSKIVNDIRIGAQRYRFDYLPDSLGIDYPSKLGLPTYGATADRLQFPSLTISNISTLSGQATLPLNRAENTFQYIDTLNWNLGRHSLLLGGDLRVYQFNNVQPQTLSGAYSFTGAFTGKTGSSYSNGIADFLLGLPASESILNGTGYVGQYVRNKRVELFLQDDFHVLPRLTLNLGIRWERDGAWRDIYDRWAYFDANTGQLVYPRTAKIPFTTFPYPYRFEDIRDIKHPQSGVSPRIGFAFRPFDTSDTVIRGAYGLFLGQSIANPVQNAATAPPFFLRQTSTSGSTTPELQFGVFPTVSSNSLLPTNPSFITLDPRNYRNGYIQQWNLGFAKQFFKDYSLKVLYVGSKGTHINRRSETNPAPPATGTIQARRRFPMYGAILMSTADAWTNYNSLQVTAEKNMSHGLRYLAAYTYSKSLDTASEWGGLSNENSIAQNPYDQRAEYGLSSTDMRHRFTLSAVYQLKDFGLHGWERNLFGRWQIASLVTWHTGFPFTITASGDIANIGQYTNSERANQVGNSSVPNRSAKLWFNPNAFANPAAYTFGNVGRNTMEGPGVTKVDFSLMKFFPVYNEQKFQFRAEYFNVLNHPIYGMPNHSVGATTFGTITSAPLIGSRIGQLALKYIF
ncbi:TonB-dependent receptor [Edaphobacter albus]|uniref:TonB-dependent receptor n=1 Tax=Edaphobacter sp. 4G125 TaxID=2763071 RepID=UPI001646BC14|nr:carboxypeptidase-like regulatory domain-containing protein [Edaphobacter sp. 4G125]QNI35754.1 carboxypeptidase regulatory-like domain-containing protein [Edaphobacter sp. 4G125]